MSDRLRLDQLTDQPTLAIEIAGDRYHFSELTIDAKGKLQAWINTHVPDPMESIKPALAGLEPDDRKHLLNEARKERLSWPPDIQTVKGKHALLDSEDGQLEAIWEGLKIHHPEITRSGAYKIMKALKVESVASARRAKKEGRKDSGERKIQRILAVLFDVVEPGECEEPAFPKDLELSKKNGSIGSSYSGGASNS